MEGAVLQEYVLNKERITIGRKPHNDVVIDNLAVSGEHAAIVTILNDSFLEDLNSTNGVMVNGVGIKKHFLQSNDVIEIGKYKLKYLNEKQGQQATAEDFDKTVVMRAPLNQSQSETALTGVAEAGSASAQAAGALSSPTPVQPVRQASALPAATLQILNGPNAGRELDLVKNLTTLGKPGVQVVVLTRRPHGYFVTHVEGAHYPSLNGKVLNAQPHQLNNHDIIELAGIKMEFYLKD